MSHLFNARVLPYRALTVFVCVLLAQGVSAEQSVGEADSTVTVLPQIEVTAQQKPPVAGSTILSENQLEKLPNKNGTLNDFLKITPATHFAEKTDPSFQAGEIKPENVSISGGRSYENNFLIDGISNSSNLDPAADKIDDINFLPGHPQQIFLGSSLVKKLTVFDHNISARYGGFTGGVVDADTIDPGDVFSGEIDYRTTRDKWANFYVHPDDQEDFDLAQRTSRQPKFEKHNVNLQLGGPINESNGILFAYSQLYSKIPLNPFGAEEKQTRRSENYFLKHVHDLSLNRTLKTSLIYAPYDEKAFLNRSRNSGFTNSQETYALQSELISNFATGTAEYKLALKKHVNERKAPADFFSWKSSFGPSKNWGLFFSPTSSSNEGGFGDLRNTEHSLSLQGHWSYFPEVSGATAARVNTGLEFEHAVAKFNRPNTAYSYKTPKALAAGDICLPDDPACVDEEQYLSKRLVYAAGSASERVNQFAAYTEVQQTVHRVTIRPGLRLSYDDLMENFNAAPRLFVSLDLTGRGNTILRAGANRYYGQNILTAKMREAIQPLAEARRTSHLTPWDEAEKTVANSRWQLSDLKTPHSDELSAGISQEIFTSLFSFDYVQRDNKDQLAKETTPFDPLNNKETRDITLNNNGRSKYRSYRLAIEKQWTKHSLSINATYEEVESSNESYADTFDEEDTQDLVFHDGGLKLKSELPREDFSRPWTVNMIYFADLPYGFSFTNTTRYQSRYRILGNTGDDEIIDGEKYDIYDEVSKPSSLTFDWRISWWKQLLNEQAVELSVDIYNVFNRKVHVGTEENEFKLGRQYWAGMTYKF